MKKLAWTKEEDAALQEQPQQQQWVIAAPLRRISEGTLPMFPLALGMLGRSGADLSGACLKLFP
ncbi:hypothetical protein C2845_PM08G21570 [Panicum miliaceum]|uniref:Uncharacterized protein n=1 Tax=Panicum miliaceum TaxID=4540 RepID=A0A3L6QXX5_PANMI|nr:hypothetical protein C2845_PM08G21570 [Panicum miliaceum]